MSTAVLAERIWHNGSFCSYSVDRKVGCNRSDDSRKASPSELRHAGVKLASAPSLDAVNRGQISSPLPVTGSISFTELTS